MIMGIEFNAKTFTAAPRRQPVVMFWGGGHTRESDPTNNGWRCRPATSGHEHQVWIVGQPGKAGCASIVEHRNGTLDVAIYLETPKEVYESVNAPRESRQCRDARYVRVDAYSGVGLRIIREIEKEREMLR